MGRVAQRGPVPPRSGRSAALWPRRFPSDGFLLLALLLYAPVGLCLLVLRLFIGVHVFLVSCALPDSVLRRCVRLCGSPGGGRALLEGWGLPSPRRRGPEPRGLARAGVLRELLRLCALRPVKAPSLPRPEQAIAS